MKRKAKMELEKYLRIKRNADVTRREHDQAEGALRSLAAQARKDHGCGSLAELRKLLTSAGKERDQLEAEIERETKELGERYPAIMK
jgi:hypothetical protein